MTDYKVDFAISYAGEDKEIANEISIRLIELGFSVFLAEKERPLLVGINGEDFFEQLLIDAKEVIVIISKHYKSKDWTRFEWDIIRERDLPNRFIPIRLDDSPILGLPSNIFYIKFNGNNYEEMVKSCVLKLLSFEKEYGIKRQTEYEAILDEITNSKGTLAKAYQLVKDKRTRSPLTDCEIPKSQFEPSYQIKLTEWCNFSIVKRLSVKIIVPSMPSREELRFNLGHCAATLFNIHKPDALMVFAYYDSVHIDLDAPFTAGRVIFAPFGKWESAKDGVAYNIPTEQFEFSITYAQ